jgi:hypothetical protein
VAQVNGAQHSIKFMAFTYTQKDLANAMIARQKAGVQAQGVIENRGASQGSAPALYCGKVSTKLDGNKYTMRHKVMIIDDKTAITGSFNFTQTANDAHGERRERRQRADYSQPCGGDTVRAGVRQGARGGEGSGGTRLREGGMRPIRGDQSSGYHQSRPVSRRIHCAHPRART